MTTENYNVISLIVYIISAVIALGMLKVAIAQLDKLTYQVKEAVKSNEEAIKSNRINELGAFLEMESQIKTNRLELSKASIHALDLKDKGKQDELDSASLYLNECIENYLNSLDRLCFCIIKGYFDNDDMKIEYRHVLNDAVKENPTYFQQSSKHRNIIKIHEKWADS
ncbi:hypothetical protein [Pectobacterium aquaticum]|uniref:hypothetical protein n=1 Tax=Pectobacterium aquaticum TaxID=2204145 RepID=UPI000E273B08|nr:hypothetical protein [Pectobacterium aquaticum]UEM37670.1 hypothetical protein DMB82_0010630 [Pectobacterium aquaticum]UEM37683.1 hypothetical protein DMB82_0010695 [Pectobacterium aquaticum]